MVSGNMGEELMECKVNYLYVSSLCIRHTGTEGETAANVLVLCQTLTTGTVCMFTVCSIMDK